MNYLTTQHTEVSSIEKITWTKKLNDFRDHDQQRIYYYRQKCLNDIKGWHYVDCKRELTIFNNKGEYGYRNEPYRIHKVFLKSQVINHPGTWNRGEKLEVNYYNALCCKCWEKTRCSVLVEKTETSETFELENNKCDCQEYLNERIIKQEETIKRNEAKLKARELVARHLKTDREVWVNEGILEVKLNEQAIEYLNEFSELNNKKIEGLTEYLEHERKELNKLFLQLEQVKYLLGIDL